MNLERLKLKMKYKLPFIIPENDINLKIARYLVIIDILAYTSRGKYVLDIEKLTIFDFLVRNPYILKQVLIIKHNEDIKLQNQEIKNIETLYPNKSELIDTQLSKLIIQVMISEDIIIPKIEKGKIFFSLTDTGKRVVNELDVEYICRINELCNKMLVLRSTSLNELKKIINPLIRGV